MSTQEITYIIPLSIPLYVSFICGLLLLKMFFRNDSILGRKPLLLSVFACMISAFGWLAIIFYITVPHFFVLMNPVLFLAFTSIHVIYYHFIFEMTRIQNDEKFPVIHYLFPVLLSLGLLIWSLFIPYDFQVSIADLNDIYIRKFKLSPIYFSFRFVIFIVWNIIYALFGLYRVIHFRKEIVNYSADEQRISFTWLYQFLSILLLTLPISILAICLPKHKSFPFLLLFLFIVVAVLKNLILTHNILLNNFVIIRPDVEEPEECETDVYSIENKKRDDIKKLETYILRNKPYLNPKLKITDLTRELGTNRTSLSLLINSTYGMNFCRYINLYRLKELERLKEDPVYAGLSELEQVLRAGFSDYRGYKRVKERERFR